MKKVLILSASSLIMGISMQAQSSQKVENKEIESAKNQTEIKQVVKIDKLNVAPVKKVRKENFANRPQPVKKEEEVKSIETNQK